MDPSARSMPFLSDLLARAIERAGQLSPALARAERDSEAAELEHLQRAVERLGWAIGSLGAALGADAMGPRHHPDGLAILIELAADGLPVEGPLPRLAVAADPLVLVSALEGLGATRIVSGPADGSADSGWSFGGQGPPPSEEQIRDLEGFGLRLNPVRAGWTLAVPAAWLQDVA